jgi:hypothetical protein
MQRRFIAGVAALGLMLSPAVAAADRRGFSIGSDPAWFVMGGGTGGGTVATGDRGGFVGGELSLVRVREARFLGLYVDGYHDFGVDGTYVTAGPELGWIRRSPTFPIGFGIDGGGALRHTDDTAYGATGRVFVSFFGTVSLYGRYVYLDTEEDEHVVQIGMTFKFPLGPAL